MEIRESPRNKLLDPANFEAAGVAANLILSGVKN